MDNADFILLGGLAGLLFSFVLSWSSIKKIVQIHQYSLLSTAGTPGENIGELTGIVEDERTIKSPLSQTACVFWHAEVLELISSGEDSYWETVFNETSVHSFDVFDIKTGKGKCRVYPIGAELLLHYDLYKEAGTHVTLEPTIMKTLSKLPISPVGNLGFTTPIRVSEQVIKAGETVYILGKIKEQDGAWDVSSAQDGSPFLISDRSQRAVLASLYWRITASALLFAAAGVFFARLFIGR